MEKVALMGLKVVSLLSPSVWTLQMVMMKVKEVAGLKAPGFPSLPSFHQETGEAGKVWSSGKRVGSGVSKPMPEARCSYLQTLRPLASSRTFLSLCFLICYTSQ